MASTRFINPDTLSKPPTYTQVVEVTAPGRTIYVSGQLAGDRDGKLVAGDFRAQAVRVYRESQGGTGGGRRDLQGRGQDQQLPRRHQGSAGAARRARGYLNAAALPASTTLGSLTFAREGALLEVEVIAVLPLKSAAKAKSKRGSARKGKVSARRKGR